MIHFGEKIKLGPLDTVYSELIRRWRNDPKVYRWTRQNDVIPDFAQKAWFDKQATDPSIKMYLIYEPNDCPIGVCGLTSMDMINRRAEFSLYVSPNYRSKGYGRASLRTLLMHAFQSFGLHQVWGEVFDQNPAYEFFLDVGFRKEGTRRQFYFRDGQFIDAHLISILRDEFLRL